jgi:hypothetical protein
MKAVLRRAHTFVFVVLAFLFCAGVAVAQSAGPRGAPQPPATNDPPLTTFEEELRAKHAIKLAEKDHQENLNRARELGDLGKELQESLKKKLTLDRDSLKKIERLEKLTRKIRGEAGGEDEEISIPDRPSDISSAAERIAKATEELSKDVQNTPRQVVSASVIGNANVLLELIKILRNCARQP